MNSLIMNEESQTTVIESIFVYPGCTEKEKQNYTRQKEKSHFTSPEEEYMWANNQIKKCSKCGEDKKLTEFSGNTSGTDAFDRSGYRLRRPECSECTKKVSQGKIAAKIIAKTNNISYKAPEGTTCAICKKLPVKGNELVFDHCHKTEKFRGYCCNSCNRSMGVLGDDVEGMMNVINYLLKSEPRQICQNEDGSLMLIT